MITQIISSTQVAKDMYIERSADFQIKKIIADMARPGYVLVARQMGKTNLLLHTKDVLQNDTDIFIYCDFSTMAGYSERECLNSLIDTAIEVNPHLFADAESEIAEFRNSPSYHATRMFNRELRILLKYANKIVFLLDEIDALTRTEYSDRVFSLIRGHYFANTNFPELKRATFILSGVIEPKDIIKDPNISPFNIGEKIYLCDFSYSEFLKLIEHSIYLKGCSKNIINRIYYWTKGQPRISWDLCQAVEEAKCNSLEEIDSIVKKIYLTSFDLAPVDSIRNRVAEDNSLRDALIQLCIDKGDSLSDDIKRRLYLEGIIDYEHSILGFKNPILEKSISFEWLLSLCNHDLNYLREAEDSFHSHNYKKAITHLTQFIDTNPKSKEELCKANYLLGEAYLRTYQTEKSQQILANAVIMNNDKFKYKSILLQGYNYLTNDDYNNAERCFNEILSKKNIEDENIHIKAMFGLADVYMSTSNMLGLRDMEKELRDYISQKPQDFMSGQLFSTCFYYLSCMAEFRDDSEKCVYYLDTALQTAQPSEKPILLYKKLLNIKGSNDEIVRELYTSLSEIKDRPTPENFDDPLGFNIQYACRILAEFIIHYPKYDVNTYMRFFLYESKENAIVYIFKVINEAKDENSTALLKHIISLFDDPDWKFNDENYYIVAIFQVILLDSATIGDKCIMSINEKTNSIQSVYIYTLFSRIISFHLRHGNIFEAEKTIDIYDHKKGLIENNNQGQIFLIDYFRAYLYHRKNKFNEFQKIAIPLLEKVEFFEKKYNKKDELLLAKEDLYNIINNLRKWLKETQNVLCKIGVGNTVPKDLGRNDKVKVKDAMTGNVFVDKYKRIETDLNLGKLLLIEVCH